MWPPDVEATARCVPEGRGKIVFDRFHIIAPTGKAIEAVRRHKRRALKATGDEAL